MANELLNALRRNLERAEQLGQTDRAKRLKDRISEEEGAAEKAATPLTELTKAELLERAADADIEGRSSMNKDELIDALSEED